MTRHEEVCGGGSSSALHDSCRYMYWVRSQISGVNQLKGIFPDTERNISREALERASGCIETATEALLDDDDDGKVIYRCLGGHGLG